MSTSTRSILRKLGQSRPVEEVQKVPQAKEDDREAEKYMTPTELRHSRFRRRQKELSDLIGDGTERLPVAPVEAPRPKAPPKRVIQFEASIEKLIEKYKDPEVISAHMSYGQLARYELKDGKIYEKGKLIYNGVAR